MELELRRFLTRSVAVNLILILSSWIVLGLTRRLSTLGTVFWNV